MRDQPPGRISVCDVGEKSFVIAVAIGALALVGLILCDVLAAVRPGLIP